MRLIDIDDDRNCYIGSDGEYERYNIDPHVLAEAEPERKNGRWVYYSKDLGFSHKCSNCNFTIREQWVDLYNYCPNCGCDMREKNNA